MKTKRPLSQSKTGQLKHHLRDLAFRRGPDAKLPTTRELCMLFGASSVTLNDALADLEAQNVIIRRQGSGIYVSPKLHHKCVRIFFNSNQITRSGLSPFWGVLSGLILGEAQRRAATSQNIYGFELIQASAYREEALAHELLRLYREGLLHGILAVGMGEQPVQVPFDADVPVVSYADTGHWQIRSNFEEATRLGVGALADLGCSRIGFWHSVDEGTEYDLYGKPMIPVLEALCRERQLPLYPELVQLGRNFVVSGPDLVDLTLQERGYLIAKLVFTRPNPRPDGLFLGDDMFAEGVLTAFNELGIKPGTDIQVVSICNAGSPMLFGYEEVLTRVEYDPAELVVTFFDVLEVLMAHGVPDPGMMQRKPRLVMPGDRARRNEILSRCGL